MRVTGSHRSENAVARHGTDKRTLSVVEYGAYFRRSLQDEPVVTNCKISLFPDTEMWGSIIRYICT